MKSIEELKRDIVFETTLRRNRLSFHSTWGLFSPRGVDNGSYLLIEHIDIEDGQKTLDLGCGYGPVGVAIAKATPKGFVDMVDKDFVAVEFAKKNAAINHLNNCRCYMSNGFSHVGDGRFDNVVSNIPAKVGKELLCIILNDARKHLNPGGQLVIVTISGLKAFIKRNFKEVFGNYKKLKQGRDYAVWQAIKEPE